MAPRLQKTRLIERVARGGDVVTFRFERPAGHEYQAGQWFAITIPGPSGPLDHHFSYSSSPTEPWVELTTHVRDSEFKQTMAKLKLGTEVEVEGPYGSFILAPGPEPAVFLAGGIGVTCVRSILRKHVDMLEDPPGRRIVVVHANKSEEAMPFREELSRMEVDAPGLRVVHILSHADSTWRGHRGHIDADLLGRELCGGEPWVYYASGPPGFVAGMMDMLQGLGVTPSRIRTERFDGY